MLPAISMIIVQFRNRRTGNRRTFQIAEILPDGTQNVLLQYDPRRDVLTTKSQSKNLFSTLQLFTGMTPREIDADLEEKQRILKYLVDMDITTVDGVGRVMAEYYTNKDGLTKALRSGKLIEQPKSPAQPGAQPSPDELPESARKSQPRPAAQTPRR
jgi:hypothetical protein